VVEDDRGDTEDDGLVCFRECESKGDGM